MPFYLELSQVRGHDIEMEARARPLSKLIVSFLSPPSFIIEVGRIGWNEFCD